MNGRVKRLFETQSNVILGSIRTQYKPNVSVIGRIGECQEKLRKVLKGGDE